MPNQFRNPSNFLELLNTSLLSKIPGAPSKISLRTSRRWMIFLGYSAKEKSKGYYVDDHERADVVAHRGAFLQTMEDIEKKMVYFEGEEMEVERYPDGCQSTEDNHQSADMCVLIVHDESTFNSNECNRVFWLASGTSALFPKSRGRSRMISGFMCHCHGFLSDGELKSYSCITPGANNDGYWTNKDLVEQFEKVVPLFRKVHPYAKLCFFFDNSQNHHARAPDALCASNLNLSDGGKNARLMRNTYYFDPQGARVEQASQTAAGVQKGVRTYLVERGKWAVGMNLERARAVLDAEPDFQEDKDKVWLNVIASKFGNTTIIFFPKFHCELNFIEMVWGYIKAVLRKMCTFKFEDLCKNLDEIVNNIPLAYVRRVNRHYLRFMDGYRKGFKGPILDYIMRKYRAHRAIPALSNDMISKEFEIWKKKHKKI